MCVCVLRLLSFIVYSDNGIWYDMVQHCIMTKLINLFKLMQFSILIYMKQNSYHVYGANDYAQNIREGDYEGNDKGR